MQVHLTLKSSNSKVGPIPVSTTSAVSCPDVCPLKDNGCYAASGPLAIHWRKVTAGERGTDWSAFCDAIASLPEGQLWRHNQAGDLPGNAVTIDRDMMVQLVESNLNRRGFTYTHYSIDNPHNAMLIGYANRCDFTVNVSTDNVFALDAAIAEHGIDRFPFVTLLPSGNTEKSLQTPNGNLVVRCPAEYRDISCADCQMCADNKRTFAVGFTVHGTGKRKANLIASAR
jgi:hypothetical protein